MDTITNVRLINRAFIKVPSVPKHRLYYFYKIVNISEKYGLSIRISTNSQYNEYPFIEAIYIKKPITIKEFYTYITNISDYLYMYNGVEPYTKLEFSVSYEISLDSQVVSSKSQLYLHYNIHRNEEEIIAIDYNEMPIHLIPPFKQIVITDKMLKSGIEQQTIFLKSSAS